MEKLTPGIMLIADPFLKDPNFARTVVLLCEHQEEQGSFGFIVNRLFEQQLHELIPDILIPNIPVYLGGPVQMDSVHFIHQMPDKISGGMEVIPGLYWGGNFEEAVAVANTQADHSKIKFFIGYSGWSEGQLQTELDDKSWITSEISTKLLFSGEGSETWKQALRNMGHNFAMMANFPIDPTLN